MILRSDNIDLKVAQISLYKEYYTRNNGLLVEYKSVTSTINKSISQCREGKQLKSQIDIKIKLIKEISNG